MEDRDSSAAGDAERLLLEYLRNHDAYCPLCRYNLRQLTRPVCPECGRGIRLTVGLVDPYLRAWVATIVPLCGSAGIGCLFLWLVVTEGWPRVGGGPLWELLVRATILYFMASAPVAAVGLVLRRWFLRWPRPAQWAVAVAAWMASAAAFGVIVASIR